jgi:hypothetical protein
MTHAALTVIFGVAAIFTFWNSGRQWPTAILATIFGILLGGTPVGRWIAEGVNWLGDHVNRWLS